MNDKKTFDVIFEGVAKSSGKLRCDIDVDFVTTGETFALSTDEGKIHGGRKHGPAAIGSIHRRVDGLSDDPNSGFRQTSSYSNRRRRNKN